MNILEANLARSLCYLNIATRRLLVEDFFSNRQQILSLFLSYFLSSKRKKLIGSDSSSIHLQEEEEEAHSSNFRAQITFNHMCKFLFRYFTFLCISLF